jgi:hypothetical protein
MYAETGNNCWLVLETHGGKMQATTKEQPSAQQYYTQTTQTLTTLNDRQGEL